jgi:hypothetical protein
MEQEELMALFQKEEPLCNELLAYYCNDGRFPVVQHPLVYSVPHSNQMNAMLNFQYKIRQEEMLKKLADEDWEGYVFIHEKPFRLNAFLIIADSIQSDGRYWELLGEIWVNSENIWQNLREWRGCLKSKRLNQHLFMSIEDFETFRILPEELTIYRGYGCEANMSGMSYTLILDKALWFAQRFGQNGGVLKKQIKKEDAFAYMNSRGEQEIILL